MISGICIEFHSHCCNLKDALYAYAIKTVRAKETDCYKGYVNRIYFLS